MDHDSSKRLAEVARRKKVIDEQAAEKARTAEAHAHDRQQQRATAQQLWEMSRRELTLAINAVNATIVPNGLRFQEQSEEDVIPALARLYLKLVMNGKSGRNDPKIRLDVSALGKVQAAFLLPGARAGGTDFDVSDANQQRYTDLLISFLEKLYPK